MKFCKDCRYLYRDRYNDYCRNEKSLRDVNMVSGYHLYSNADTMRYLEDRCGEEAKWFEPKKKWYQF